MRWNPRRRGSHSGERSEGRAASKCDLAPLVAGHPLGQPHPAVAFDLDAKRDWQGRIVRFGHDTQTGIACFCCMLEPASRPPKRTRVEQHHKGKGARPKQLFCRPPRAGRARTHQEHTVQDHATQPRRVEPPDRIDDADTASAARHVLQSREDQVDAPAPHGSVERSQSGSGPTFNQAVELWDAERQPCPGMRRSTHGSHAVEVLPESSKGVGAAGHRSTGKKRH